MALGVKVPGDKIKKIKLLFKILDQTKNKKIVNNPFNVQLCNLQHAFFLHGLPPVVDWYLHRIERNRETDSFEERFPPWSGTQHL